MDHTTDHDGGALLAGRAHAVVPGAGGLRNASYEDFSHIVGAGSVWSTARDLHRFVQGVVSGRLGRAAQASYVRGGKLDFNGIAGGFRAFCDWDSASGLEVVFVGNLHTGAPDLIRSTIAKLAAGETVAPASVPAPALTPLPAPELARYEGTFVLGSGTRLVLRVRDGALWANDWVLVPTRDGAFFSPRDYGTVRGVNGPDGTISRLDWEQRGTVYPAPRVAD
jgi:hypothetical protein